MARVDLLKDPRHTSQIGSVVAAADMILIWILFPTSFASLFVYLTKSEDGMICLSNMYLIMNINATFSNGFEYTCGLFQSIFDIQLFGGTLYAQFDLSNFCDFELNYLPEHVLEDLRLIRSLTDADYRMPYSEFEKLDDENYWKSQATFVQVWTTADQHASLTKLTELCKDHAVPLPNFGNYSNDEDGVYSLYNDCWDLVCKIHHDPYESELCRTYLLGVCIHHMLSGVDEKGTLSATFEV